MNPLSSTMDLKFDICMLNRAVNSQLIFVILSEWVYVRECVCVCVCMHRCVYVSSLVELHPRYSTDLFISLSIVHFYRSLSGWVNTLNLSSFMYRMLTMIIYKGKPNSHLFFVNNVYVQQGKLYVDLTQSITMALCVCLWYHEYN